MPPALLGVWRVLLDSRRTGAFTGAAYTLPHLYALFHAKVTHEGGLGQHAKMRRTFGVSFSHLCSVARGHSPPYHRCFVRCPLLGSALLALGGSGALGVTQVICGRGVGPA
jgi:hypothetical protein